MSTLVRCSPCSLTASLLVAFGLGVLGCSKQTEQAPAPASGSSTAPLAPAAAPAPQ